MRSDAANFHELTPAPSHFPTHTLSVLDALAQLSEAQQQKLFKTSPAKWAEVQALFQPSTKDFIDPADGPFGLYAYTGEAYKFFDAPSLSFPAAARATENLAILSGLYGVVTPAMRLRPYRMEMQSTLPVGEHRNLYALWKPLITQWINDHPAPFVVNACSGEYSKAVDWKRIDKPVVHVDFKQRRDGVVKSISAFGKQARGQFARWVFEENIQTILSLAAFQKDGYQLSVHDGDKMIFLREA